MIKFLNYGAIALVFLLAVLLFNALRLTSKQMTDITPASVIPFSDSIVQHFADAIKIKTVSNGDSSKMDSVEFEKFIAFVERTYPLVHSKLKHERVNTYGLLFEWKGRDLSLLPTMMIGHYDVVPMIKGTEKLWQHEPFSGAIDSGFIYGRGTIDDKLTVIGILESVEYLLKQNFQPERTMYLGFGFDEEVSGNNGAKKIAALLESRKIQLEYVLDEGGVIKSEGLSGLDKPIALIGVAEKGYTTLQLSVTSASGHSSMPPPQTSIGILAEAIDKLEKKPFPAHFEGGADLLQDYLAPEMPFGLKIAMGNRWLLKSVIMSKLASTNAGNAMIRTTTAPTVISAGVKDNVLPINATAKVNFRILPGETSESVLAYVTKVVDNKQVKIEHVNGSVNDPTSISDTASFGFRNIHRTVKRCFPNAIVSPYLCLGGTDVRNYKNVSKNQFRFQPLRVSEEDLGRIHGTNECISTESFKDFVRFYIELMKGS